MAVKLSALRAGLLDLAGRFLYTNVLEAEWTQGHNAAGRIGSVATTFSDLIGTRSCIVPEPSSHHAPLLENVIYSIGLDRKGANEM
jgi:hypothetical protein